MRSGRRGSSRHFDQCIVEARLPGGLTRQAAMPALRIVATSSRSRREVSMIKRVAPVLDRRESPRPGSGHPSPHLHVDQARSYGAPARAAAWSCASAAAPLALRGLYPPGAQAAHQERRLRDGHRPPRLEPSQEFAAGLGLPEPPVDARTRP